MRDNLGFVVTKAIESAYLNAINALEGQNSDNYFAQLAILYQAYEDKGDGIKHRKNVSFELFLRKLAEKYQSQIKALSKNAIEFYYATNAELTGFTETAAVMVGSLSEPCAPESRKAENLKLYSFLFGNCPPKLPVSETSTSYRVLKLGIGRVLLVERTSRLFLSGLDNPSTENFLGPIPHDLIRSAFNAFDYETSSELLPERLFELAKEHWSRCIDALNTENINEFYRELAALAKTAAFYLTACGKDTLGESSSKFFKKLHAAFNLTEKNFLSRLTAEGLSLYTTLFNYHLNFTANSADQECGNFEQRIALNNELTASTFCRDLLPVPLEFGTKFNGNIDKIKTELRIAIQNQFYDPSNLPSEQREKLRTYEQSLARNQREREATQTRIQKSQSGFLTALSNELSDKSKNWHLAGKSKAYVLFLLFCSCAAYKTPDGISRLQILVSTESKDQRKLFKSVEQVLERKIKAKNIGRSKKTKEFYTLWYENMKKAKQGEFTTQLAM